MNKIISLALLIGGIVLLTYGVIAADSPLSDLSRIFTGAPTDKATKLLLSGCVAAILGAAGLVNSSKTA